MVFSLDFAVAGLLVIVLALAFYSSLSLSASSVAEGMRMAEKQRSSLLDSDFALKNCFPEGIALCEGGFLHSHVAHPDANLSFSKGFCAKRLVLQDGVVRVLCA